MKIKLFILASLLLSLSMCYDDSEEELYPQGSGPCVSTDVTYSGIIAPMLNDNCNVCHGNSNVSNGGSIDLRSYAQVNSRKDLILKSIFHQSGAKAMPEGGGSLSPCALSQYQNWYDNG
ncbi:MAG: hypothetical protein RIS47_862, partial [Bacteroidota bacterium]